MPVYTSSRLVAHVWRGQTLRGAVTSAAGLAAALVFVAVGLDAVDELEPLTADKIVVLTIGVWAPLGAVALSRRQRPSS